MYTYEHSITYYSTELDIGTKEGVSYMPINYRSLLKLNIYQLKMDYVCNNVEGIRLSCFDKILEINTDLKLINKVLTFSVSSVKDKRFDYLTLTFNSDLDKGNLFSIVQNETIVLFE